MRKLLVAGLLGLSLFIPFAAHATIAISDTGLEATGNEAQYATDSNSANITVFVGKYIIQPVLGIVGLVFFVLMIYGGLLWMTAAGNDTQIKNARTILINSVIGAAIVVAAYAITTAVFNALTSGSVSAV